MSWTKLVFVKVSKIMVLESDSIKGSMPFSDRIVSILGHVICFQKLRIVQILLTILYCNIILTYNPRFPLPIKTLFHNHFFCPTFVMPVLPISFFLLSVEGLVKHIRTAKRHIILSYNA